ncbi:MAG: hypothetical protein AAB898_00760, partial [Patescibacteria group bacterium]
ERSLQETAGKIEASRAQLEELSKSWFSRLWHRKEQQRAREEVQAIFEQEAGLEAQELHLEQEQQEKVAQLSELTQAREQDAAPQDILTDYYQRERDRWNNMEVDWEAVDTHFTAENLSQLDLESYVDLLRRFPSEMVTHVSRRGVRDRIGEVHSGGENQYYNSFDSLLEARRLKSGIGAKLDSDTRDQYIADAIGLNEAESLDDAHKRIDDMSGETGWNTFGDHSAIHFAAEWVADSYYGTEKGNEVFMVFPSALIAAEYQFGGGHSQGLTKASEDAQRNDLWVWEKEQEGIPVDAGIVFLPADAPVDEKTGSRYALTESLQPVINTELLQAVDNAIDSDAFQEALVWLKEEEERVQALPWGERNIEQDSIEERFLNHLTEHVTPNPRLADILTKRGSFLFERRQSSGSEDRQGEYVYLRDETIKELGHYLAPATETIPSQQYWEQYFQDHPERKPSKIVYYSGDPSEALGAWKQQNGLTKRSKDTPSINYNERRIDYAEASPTKSRFQALARQVADRHFAAQETKQAA